MRIRSIKPELSATTSLRLHPPSVVVGFEASFTVNRIVYSKTAMFTAVNA